MTFVIGKMKLVSFILFLDAFPLDPRCHLDSEMLLLTFTTYVKGILGLGGGQFENLVFVTMSTRENIRLIARIPLISFTYTRLPNDRMLYIWLNIKTTPPGSKSKIGECHASYVWGINLRSESPLVLSDLLFA